MSDEPLVDDLRRLRPAAPALDAIAVAYAAGRRSAHAATRRWRATAMAMATVALALVASLGRPARPASPQGPTVALVASTSPDPTPSHSGLSDPASPDPAPPDPSCLAVLQQQILRYGLAGLPRAAAIPLARPLRSSDLLREGDL